MLTVESRSKFHYELREAGEIRAVVRMPTRPAMARNAAFSIGANGVVEIDVGGRACRVEYETFDAPGTFGRLYRFFLMDGDATIATATSQPGRPRRWDVQAGPDAWQLMERSSASSMRFDLARDGAVAGTIRESTRLLALRRRFEVALPGDMTRPVQAFVFFLAVNATFR